MLPRSSDLAAKKVNLPVVFETVLFFFRRNLCDFQKSEPDFREKPVEVSAVRMALGHWEIGVRGVWECFGKGWVRHSSVQGENILEIKG